MDEGNLMLLLQLVNGLDDSFFSLEKAYDKSDKAQFDVSKAALLDFQNKIEYILKNVP